MEKGTSSTVYTKALERQKLAWLLFYGLLLLPQHLFPPPLLSPWCIPIRSWQSWIPESCQGILSHQQGFQQIFKIGVNLSL